MTTDAVRIRPMATGDRPGMRLSTQAAFDDLAARVGRPDTGTPSASGAAIIGGLLDRDAEGAWVAEAGGRICGAALAGVRDGLWYLAHLHVAPGHQGQGVGRRLLAAALGHGPAPRGRLLHASLDPQALYRYQRSGFSLDPAFEAFGTVARAALPAATGVRPGDAGDLDLAADVDRAQRGAAHGIDLEAILGAGARLLVHDGGYAVLDPGPVLLAATSVEAATALLWAALAETDGVTTVPILRAGQDWAIDVVHRAGLRLRPTGPLCRAGTSAPMTTYLPHTGVL
ncbi:GNAT family N-acetyltransferase [Dactylosporangium sp. AC04546]|uniref:GNAT family N-acetyltransferase n=1 Tax=Dactylosporangium sp. AC04546 TaxID=2862460 RepID=UPI001EDEB51A|nr:GNAT family N-acetyltransferase [Dactylosporangium sp. AC04546]WVK89270.1 GNAT family N-acetyltransferase [Dactylosporangium sp. AC04546]